MSVEKEKAIRDVERECARFLNSRSIALIATNDPKVYEVENGVRIAGKVEFSEEVEDYV